MNSSWIDSISRDDNTGTVTLATKKGDNYNIEGMSVDAFNSWQDADSAGSHFSRNVQGRYSINKL
jgi:hypothetical protein